MFPLWKSSVKLTLFTYNLVQAKKWKIQFYLDHLFICDVHYSVSQLCVFPALHMVRPFSKQHCRQHRQQPLCCHFQPVNNLKLRTCWCSNMPNHSMGEFQSELSIWEEKSDPCPPGMWLWTRQMFLDPGGMQPFGGSRMKTPKHPSGFSWHRSPVANI